LKRNAVGFGDSGIQGFRDSGIQGFRDSGIQGFRDSGIQGFRDELVISLGNNKALTEKNRIKHKA
jgi:hypothetical protein